MNLNIITIMIGFTGVIPPAEKTSILCGYPGCKCSFTRGNDRVSHWLEVHNIKAPDVNITSLIEAISGIFVGWSQFSQVKGTSNIKTPCICPLCSGRHTICQNNHALKQHITTSKDEIHKKCKELSKSLNFVWALIITCVVYNINLTPASMLDAIDGVSCPYCNYISGFKNQVSSHISTAHRDMMTDSNRINKKDLPIPVRIQNLRSLKPIHGYDFLNKEHKDHEEVNIPSNSSSATSKSTQVSETSEVSGSDAFDDILCSPPIHKELNKKTKNNNKNKEKEKANSNNTTVVSQNQQTHDSQQEQSHAAIIDNTVTHSEDRGRTRESEPNRTEEQSITMEEVRNAKQWQVSFSDNEISLPRLRKKQREKVAPLISKYWEFEAIPNMKKFINNNLNIPDEDKWNAIDGLISKIEHDVVEIIKKKLKLSGTRKSRTIDEADQQMEVDFSNLSRYKTAASNAAALLRDILATKENNDISETLKFNKIQDYEDRCLYNIKKIDPNVSKELFDKSPDEVDHADVARFVNQDIRQLQARIQWLSNTVTKECNELDEISKQRKRASEKKAQEIYTEDCKRAMRWFVTNNGMPACPIDLEEVEKELSQRWTSNNSFVPVEDTIWRATQLQRDLADSVDEKITESARFIKVIESRSKQSANGPDGIGYSILQMGMKHSATLLALISKAMLKHKRFPSRWLTARSILIYKHGDPSALSNWRPITISSCVYRVWAGVVSSAIQEINLTRPLFCPAQKGFVAGVNGCLEHTAMISEIIASANRSKRNLYMLTIDLKDAFGSLPHSYIKEVLEETGFSESFRKIIMDSYNGASTKIWINGKASNQIAINKGVKQGCPFSPLLFNLCINPLIRELAKSTKGFKIQNKYHNVQAYADDIILFSETKENMNDLLNEVSCFINYAKLEINAEKCHSVSYTLVEGHRVSDTSQFSINGKNIPNHNLSEWVEYLGTAAATTLNIRRKGTDEAIIQANELVDQIFDSPLKINQMIDAVKRFVIPSLDYVLTEGSPRLTDLKKLDTKIRTRIAKHIGVPNIPVAFAHSHWMNGGLSLQPLETRAKALKIKSFIALMNSSNVGTRIGFRDCVEEERQHRAIKKVEPANSQFLDWETDTKGKFITDKHGTSALCARAKDAADRLNITIKYDNDSAACVKIDDLTITNPKEISSTILKREMEKSFTALLSSDMHGHSFVNMKDNKNSNSIIGNYSHNINDKIVSFALAARTNELATGNILSKKPHHDTAGDKGCPYCNMKGKDDTLAHRLNGCRQGRVQQTIRHNMIVKEIIDVSRKKFKNARIRADQAIRVNRDELAIKVGDKTYRPDIFIEDDKACHIIEVTVPYDGMTSRNGRNTTILDDRYTEKMRKYEDLRLKAEDMFGKRCSLTAVVVSSLGTLYKKSCKELHKLLHISKKERNTLDRRISTAAIIGSFFVFYKIKKDNDQRNKEYEITDEAAGDPLAEEP